MPAKLVDQAMSPNLLMGVTLIALTFAFGPIANAQLRSGQVDRALYQNHAAAKKPATSAKIAQPSATRRTGVVPASAWQEAEVIQPQASVPAVPSMNFIEPMPMDDYSATVHGDAGCDSCGDNTFAQGSMLGSCSSCDSCDAFPVGPLDPCSPVNWFPSLRGPMYFDGPIARILTNTAVRAELMLYQRSGQDIPALASTGSTAGNQILFGNDTVGDQGEGGGRITASMWLDSSSSLGLVGRYWNAGKSNITFSSDAAQNPNLVRPFIDFGLAQPAPGEVVINRPGIARGNWQASVISEIDGGDIMFRKLLGYDVQGRWDFLAGYQTLELNEELMVRSYTETLPLGTPTIEVTDRFLTSNHFDGGLLGVQGFYRRGRWSLDGLFKLGLGNMERNVTIAGTSLVNGTTLTDNGLLARFTNSGNYVSNTFVAVPELNLTVGYRLRSNLELTLGYTYTNIPKVAQAANQVDPQLGSNLNLPLTGPVRPAFQLVETDVSLNAFAAGLQWNY